MQAIKHKQDMVENPSAGFAWQYDYRHLPADMFVDAVPEAAPDPAMLLFNKELACQLGLDVKALQKHAAAWFSGKALPPGARPLAQAYAGHQFGTPAMLGDGRQIMLGEHQTGTGAMFDIALKGAGQTPFSRRGDGHGTLDAMAREYLVSEAMHALGIATTRSLALVKTGGMVIRRGALPGAVLTRVASSHIRVGTFQYAAWHRNKKLLPALFDYTLNRHYPALVGHKDAALELLDKVMQKHIHLVTEWSRVGFIHGVMNTDNVTISGETLDYGPCAFLDEYEPGKVFSSIDTGGRYAFANQGVITQWNMQRLAETLLPLIDDDETCAIKKATDCLECFMPRFHEATFDMLCAKLGLVHPKEGDDALVRDWLDILERKRLDYTQAHQQLAEGQLNLADDDYIAWHQRWQQRYREGGDAAAVLMARSNPVIIPRNHQIERALKDLLAGHSQTLTDLQAALATPYTPRSRDDAYRQPPAQNERVLATYCGT